MNSIFISRFSIESKDIVGSKIYNLPPQSFQTGDHSTESSDIAHKVRPFSGRLGHEPDYFILQFIRQPFKNGQIQKCTDLDNITTQNCSSGQISVLYSFKMI
jgi:hypothetical protein